MAEVEEIVNNKIINFLPVKYEEMSMKDAVKSGATALFGEKYGDTVRVVTVGDFSKELCGGTHVSNSGLIGAFKIVSEAGVAAGVRRIEAITGSGILAKAKEAEAVIANAAEILKTSNAGLLSKLTSVSEEAKALKKELDELKKSALSSSLDSVISEAKTVGDVKLLTQAFVDYDINDLRQMFDDIKKNNKGYIIVFA